jgi:uncharacterized membrane protein
MMILWVVSAVVLDYWFLAKFPKLSKESKLELLKGIQRISNKTEMPASSFLPLIGVLMLMEKTFWLKVGLMHGKIAISMIAIGMYHASRGVSNKMMAALESGSRTKSLAKKYIFYRIVTLVFLLGIVWMIADYKGVISTFHIIKSGLE